MFNCQRLIFTLCATILLSSCSTQVNEYKGSTPVFDIKSYFNGKLVAWGMVQDYSNKTTRRFCVELNGTWKGNNGTLAEKFYFNDGEINFRTWQLTKLPNDRYNGTADDVVGIAKGQQSGFAFQWQYHLLVPIDGTNYQFSMDDWMYQLDEHRIMNKTSMSKFGIKVAEINLFFDKNNADKTCK